MIYEIGNPYDTINILKGNPMGLIVFDLEPEVDPSDITIAFLECTRCGTVVTHVLNTSANADEYCDCDCWPASTYADLVIQDNKVLYRRPR